METNKLAHPERLSYNFLKRKSALPTTSFNHEKQSGKESESVVSPEMKILLLLLCLLGAEPIARARSYAFTLENSIAQSAIVAEVEVTSSKVYMSDFNKFEEVEVECKVVRLYKGPENLRSFRVRYYSKDKPSGTRALVFAFRPSNGTELRTFNGSSGFVGEKDERFSLPYDKLKSEVAIIQKAGTAKPMDGFSEGTLDGAKSLEPESVTYSKPDD